MKSKLSLHKALGVNFFLLHYQVQYIARYGLLLMDQDIQIYLHPSPSPLHFTNLSIPPNPQGIPTALSRRNMLAVYKKGYQQDTTQRLRPRPPRT